MPLNWQLINEETLASLDLDSPLENVDRFDHHTYRDEVSRQARDDARWTLAQRECLHFVAAVVSMALKADTPNEPFGPMFVMDGQRSAIPADFSKENLQGVDCA